MICSRCGQNIDNSSVTCPNCGTRQTYHWNAPKEPLAKKSGRAGLKNLVEDRRRNKNFRTFLKQYKGSVPEKEQYDDGSPKKEIRIYTPDGPTGYAYRSGEIYRLKEYGIRISVVYDSSGNRFLILDRGEEDGEIESIPFTSGLLEVDNVSFSGTNGKLRIEIVPVASI